MLSFSSYFLPKKPLKHGFFASLLVITSAFGSDFTAVFGASGTDFAVVVEAVFGLVVLALDLVDDDFGFLVAIIPPLINI